MKKITLKNLVAVTLAMSTGLIQAAAPPPPVPPPPPGLPVDSNIVIFASIGMIYVAYKFYFLHTKKA